MAGPVNKFYHPGACHLVDAYFRLNTAWWVQFVWGIIDSMTDLSLIFGFFNNL